MTTPPPKSSSPESAIAKSHAALRAALADHSPVDLSWIHPVPADDGWTLALDALRFLHRIVVHLHPTHVLELGSGLSTRVLARACGQENIACRISSLDHDPEFGRPAAGDAADFPASVQVKFQLAPVVARDFGGKLLPAYLLDPAQLATPDPVDLILIDGPPITLGGREGTLYQVMQFARPGTLVLLDDASRASERSAVAHWKDVLADNIDVIDLPGFSRGMTAVIFKKPIPGESLWDQKIRLSANDIQRLIPEGQSYILIDQSCGDQPAPGRRAIPFLEKNGEFYGAPPTTNPPSPNSSANAATASTPSSSSGPPTGGSTITETSPPTSTPPPARPPTTTACSYSTSSHRMDVIPLASRQLREKPMPPRHPVCS